MFKIKDWVQITPSPDLAWNQWRNSQDTYKNFLDKIGSIENISNDDERPGRFLYAVKVNFINGLGQMSPGHYYEWFRPDHLILSSESTAKLRDNMAQAGKELQEWESFKKKTLDNILKIVFTPEPKQEEKIDDKKLDDPNQWDLKNPPSQQYDDKYDTYYDDDYSSYAIQYLNNTDVDHYYYADMSDDKLDEKD